MQFCCFRLRCRKFSLFLDNFMHDIRILTRIWWPASCGESVHRTGSECMWIFLLLASISIPRLRFVFGFRGPRFSWTAESIFKYIHSLALHIKLPNYLQHSFVPRNNVEVDKKSTNFVEPYQWCSSFFQLKNTPHAFAIYRWNEKCSCCYLLIHTYSAALRMLRLKKQEHPSQQMAP